MDFTRVKLANGRTVRVANEDVEAVEANDKEQGEKVKNAVDPAKLQEAMAELETVNGQLKELTAKKAELEGQLQALKDQLDAAMKPEAVEGAAATMNAEREDAGKVMNAHGLTLTDAQKKMHGDALRTQVVNAVRVKNGKPELTAEQAAVPGYVKGMFGGYLETLGTPPAGHQVVNAATVPANPGGSTEVKAINALPNADKFAAMYGKKEKV